MHVSVLLPISFDRSHGQDAYANDDSPCRWGEIKCSYYSVVFVSVCTYAAISRVMIPFDVSLVGFACMRIAFYLRFAT